MTMKILTGLLIVGVGCGEVTAEPIRAASFSITSADIAAEDSDDPYACEVVPIDAAAPSPPELLPFMRLGELGYAGSCRNGSAEQPRQCWYTGDVSCEQSGRECGGFQGSIDMAAGTYEVTGGQHMLCSYSCVRDEDCPAGGSGTARPSCMHEPEFDPATEGGQCMLTCGSGETCPDGFVCIDPGLSFSRSDGSLVPAPAQCVQFHRLSLHGDPTPP